jgi:TPP-dependent pyruvate/acetoin dehydrogenase alpha subunit
MTIAAAKPHLSREHMLDLLRQMIRIRRFEEKCAELYTQRRSEASCIFMTVRRRSQSA